MQSDRDTLFATYAYLMYCFWSDEEVEQYNNGNISKGNHASKRWIWYMKLCQSKYNLPL